MTTIHSEPAVDEMVEALKFLSDRNRLRILLILNRAETCVCDLIEELDLPQPLVSYHLGKLRKAGLVRSRREAQWMYYSLAPDVWGAMTASLQPLFGTITLAAEAAYGWSDRCDLVPPDPERGAVADDSCNNGDCC